MSALISANHSNTLETFDGFYFLSHFFYELRNTLFAQGTRPLLPGVCKHPLCVGLCCGDNTHHCVGPIFRLLIKVTCSD